MERKKQEREMKKKEKEALKKQKEAERKIKRKRVPESDSSDENNENIHYAETNSDAGF